MLALKFSFLCLIISLAAQCALGLPLAAPVAGESSGLPSLPDNWLTVSAPTGEDVSTAPDKHDLAKRTPGCVYWTEHPNWKGYAMYMCVARELKGRCVNLMDPRMFGISGISAWGPDQGTRCDIFTGKDCSGRSLTGIVYPGRSSLPRGIDDNVISYRCWW